MSPANKDSFTSYFPIWIPFLSFFLFFFFLLLWFPWLGPPKLCWIKIVRVEILLLFLISESMLSVFHHWKWSLPWVCHIWPSLYWAMSPLCPLSGRVLFFMCYNKSVLNFVKSIFCIYWVDHIVFILQFVNVVYVIDLHMLMYPYTPGINPIWSWCMSL